jgi:hypothetical protein
LADDIRRKEAEFGKVEVSRLVSELHGPRQQKASLGSSATAADLAASLDLNLSATQAASVLYASMLCDEAEAEAIRLAAVQAASRAGAPSGRTLGLYEAKAESLRLKAKLAETHAALLLSSTGMSETPAPSHRVGVGNRYLTDSHNFSKLAGNMASSTTRQAPPLKVSSARAPQRSVAPSTGLSSPPAHDARAFGSPRNDLAMVDLRAHAKRVQKELRRAQAQHEADREEMSRLRTENQQLATLVGGAREVRKGPIKPGLIPSYIPGVRVMPHALKGTAELFPISAHDVVHMSTRPRAHVSFRPARRPLGHSRPVGRCDRPSSTPLT